MKVLITGANGFVGKNLKPEHLPDTMALEEKQKFIDDCAARLHRSRWMITIIFPIILAFCLDMMYIFLLPMLEGIFQWVTFASYPFIRDRRETAL